MTKSGTGSRLCAAVALTLIVMTAFGSAAFEQQAQTSLPSWHGQLDLSALTPVYRNLASLDVTLDYDGRGNLRGRMAGEVSAEKTGGVPCTFEVTRRAKLSANLVGKYTPGTNTMSLTMTERNFVKGNWICPPVPGGGEFGHGLIDQPVLEQLLRSLTTKADGSVEATREDTSVPQNTVRVTLTLRRDYCRDLNPLPAATITPSGPTAFCQGGSLTLNAGAGYSSYLWSPGGQATQTIVVTASGSYSVTVTDANRCSATSAPTTVTVNPLPDSTIKAPATVCPNSTNIAASVPNAGLGATYSWTITNGTITSGAGTRSVTFTAGAKAAITLHVTVTNGYGCTSKSVKVVKINTSC